MISESRLTSREYWEQYYQKTRIKPEDIVRVCSAYDSIWDRFYQTPSHPPQTILEIGAYPGRYIAYLAAKYHLHPTAYASLFLATTGAFHTVFINPSIYSNGLFSMLSDSSSRGPIRGLRGTLTDG